MRSENEMMNLVLSVARGDERVRAVCMNGSRANPNAPRDFFQDFDIVFLVTDVSSYLQTADWVDVFGERVIMQLPDDSALFPASGNDRYAYLMQFTDGNRIDLTLIPVEQAQLYCGEDCETVLLLDKDGLLPPLPPASDVAYLVSRPTANQFISCCNEFLWVSPYVAKGLWRKELLYSTYHLNVCLRDMLEMMLTWKAGILTNFAVSTGKNGKYLQKHLPAEDWNALLRTFPQGDAQDIWRALAEAGELFKTSAIFVAEYFDFVYPLEEDTRVKSYLAHVRRLPSDAQSFDE